MENQNSWKQPLMVAGISLGAIFLYLSLTEGYINAFIIGLTLLFQSVISFFIGLGQVILSTDKRSGQKQMLLSVAFLLIGLGVCSTVELNLH